jgi:hypothetical protein
MGIRSTESSMKPQLQACHVSVFVILQLAHERQGMVLKVAPSDAYRDSNKVLTMTLPHPRIKCYPACLRKSSCAFLLCWGLGNASLRWGEADLSPMARHLATSNSYI